MALDAGGVWSEQDTTPGAIGDALRELLSEQYSRDEAFAPARVINLVAVVDREWRGEILNRLERVGRYHASRSIVCSVEEARKTIDASVALTTEGKEGNKAGEVSLSRERILLDIGPRHLAALDTIVDPLLVSDIATVVWSPHGHPDAVDSLLHLTQTVLVDSVNEPDASAAVARARELSREAYVVDLAWLRSTPWRERVASTFDPPQWRDELRRITSVTVRHHAQSTVAGLLFFGWLGSRLGWRPDGLMAAGDTLKCRASSRRHEVELELVPDERLSVPGLAGVKIASSDGMSISLDRGEGGLSAHRVDRKGRESSWTVLGASRGESGILGEGIRQALLRDPTYARALEQVGAMVG